MKIFPFPNPPARGRRREETQNSHDSHDPPARAGGCRVRSQLAFTLVEIAICLGVIGFALVAIIGVLPLGLAVQRENREETIINQDTSIFLDAIRSGALGLDDLTHYVFAITNYVQEYDTNRNPVGGPFELGYTYLDSTRADPPGGPRPITPQFPIDRGYRIIGLLSTPKYTPAGGGGFFSNRVVAFVHAMSGSASEKYPQQDPNVRDLSFSYRLTPEITSLSIADPDSAIGRNLTNNLHELRLLFRWPLLPPKNEAGRGRLVFRTTGGGTLVRTNDGFSDQHCTLYFFQPRTFARATQP